MLVLSKPTSMRVLISGAITSTADQPPKLEKRREGTYPFTVSNSGPNPTSFLTRRGTTMLEAQLYWSAYTRNEVQAGRVILTNVCDNNMRVSFSRLNAENGPFTILMLCRRSTGGWRRVCRTPEEELVSMAFFRHYPVLHPSPSSCP